MIIFLAICGSDRGTFLTAFFIEIIKIKKEGMI